MSRRIMVDQEKPDAKVVDAAVEALKNGDIIIYPTETVYGLGVDSTNEQAIKKLFQIKHRDMSKPVSLIAGGKEMVFHYVRQVPESGFILMELFWPGALTLVFEANSNVNRLLTGGTGTIGIRVPGSPLCRLLSDRLGCPITSSSANLSGEADSRSVDQIPDEITSAARLILDSGETHEKKPSTVISVLSRGEIALKVIREGALSCKMIESRLAGSGIKLH